MSLGTVSRFVRAEVTNEKASPFAFWNGRCRNSMPVLQLFRRLGFPVAIGRRYVALHGGAGT
jgi:hypothetical protein